MESQNSQQMRRDEQMNQGLLEETGMHVKNMAQGAADVGKGAVQGAVGIARGAAVGAANAAQGAADVMKNTFGYADNSNTNPASNMSNSNPSTKI